MQLNDQILHCYYLWSCVAGCIGNSTKTIVNGSKLGRTSMQATIISNIIETKKVNLPKYNNIEALYKVHAITCLMILLADNIESI